MSKKKEAPHEDEVQEATETAPKMNAEESEATEQEEAIEKLQQELAEQKEKLNRLLAEFDNYKRRTAKERLDIIKTAGQDIINDLLPVLDDVERADQVITKATDIDALKQGLELITEKLRHVTVQKGLKAMEAQGLPFDAETMEAVTELDAGKEMKGKVVDVIEKGYTLNDKIIRYSKVVVGK